MDALDGNAIAGALFDLFGNEMTTAVATCGHCGAVAQIAELRVYSRAPGTVVRCASCGNVVFVVLDVAGKLQVEMSGLQLASDV